jgi:YggT family protein
MLGTPYAMGAATRLRGRGAAASLAQSRRSPRRVITGLFTLIFYIIEIYIWVIIATAVFSLLTAFSVLDTRNRAVWMIGDFLYRVTDPALRPIRQVLPSFGGLDLSPWALILLLQFIVMPFMRGLYGLIMTGSIQPLLS